jgi:hypothetical protein
MIATLEQIEKDPTLLRRAIEQGESVQILRDGRLAGNFTPEVRLSPPVEGAALWDIEELRAWRRRVWGERVFSDEEEREMRDAEDGVLEN